MFLRRYVVSGLSALVLALTPSFSAFSGCGNDSSPAGCQDDAECKGDRICIDHKCVSPSEKSNGDAGTSQPTCTSHVSKVCSGSDIYWQNSCGSLEEVAQDCASGQYCNNAQCVDEAPVCTSNNSKVCSNGDVYWRDSCGNLEGRATDCTSTERCDNAVCVTVCTPHSDKVCNNGDVYWRDSCGNLEGRATDCTSAQYCDNAQCVDEEPVCTSQHSKICYQGDAFWQDSCGNRQSVAEDCVGSEICADGECVCEPHQTRICYDGDVYWVNGCDVREERAQDCVTITQRCEEGSCVSVPKWEDLGDGTIYYHHPSNPQYDKIWQANPTTQLMTNPEGVDYCENLTLAGRTNWILPEYLSVIEKLDSGYGCFEPGLNGPCGIYWTSARCDSRDPTQHVARNFRDWIDDITFCERNEILHYVRCFADP